MAKKGNAFTSEDATRIRKEQEAARALPRPMIPVSHHKPLQPTQQPYRRETYSAAPGVTIRHGLTGLPIEEELSGASIEPRRVQPRFK